MVDYVHSVAVGCRHV